MSSVDGLCLPVSPVDVLFKQSHGKDVGDVLAEDCKYTSRVVRGSEPVTQKANHCDLKDWISMGGTKTTNQS